MMPSVQFGTTTGIEHQQVFHSLLLGLQKRQQYIPQALAIIEEISAEFKTWLEHRKYAPLLKAIKDKWRPAQESSSDALPILAADVNKITGQIATYLKENPKDAPVASKLLTHIFELEINSDAL